jgi:hypothetical protein
MTVPQVRDALAAPAIPRPRSAERAPLAQAPTLPAARYPWPEPWGSFRGARPRTEYWDVHSASWHSRGPLPRPGDRPHRF